MVMSVWLTFFGPPCTVGLLYVQQIIEIWYVFTFSFWGRNPPSHILWSSKNP